MIMGLPEMKIRPNSRASGGQTPLSLAAWQEHEAMVRLPVGVTTSRQISNKEDAR
jgi:hypothetical protein